MFQIKGNFNLLDMLAEARNGRFDPQDLVKGAGLDLKGARFVGPDAMACVKALLLAAQRNLPPEACIPVYHDGQDAINYLKRMDFFEGIRWCTEETAENFTRHNPTGRFVPIKRITHLRESPVAANTMVQCLLGNRSGTSWNMRSVKWLIMRYSIQSLRMALY